MVGGKRAVFGIYDSESSADRAADTLTKSDFPISEVSVLVPALEPGDAGAEFVGTLGLLTESAAISIPGKGLIIAGGPIVANLRGKSFGGADGGLSDALILMGIQEVVAMRYEGRLGDGEVLLSVHCDTPEEIIQAKDLMERAGGEDITSTNELSADSAKSTYRAVSGGNR